MTLFSNPQHTFKYLNKNTVKVSYRCIADINAAHNDPNKSLLRQRKQSKRKNRYSWISTEKCHIDKKCFCNNITCKAEPLAIRKMLEKTYFGTNSNDMVP